MISSTCAQDITKVANKKPEQTRISFFSSVKEKRERERERKAHRMEMNRLEMSLVGTAVHGTSYADREEKE